MAFIHIMKSIWFGIEFVLGEIIDVKFKARLVNLAPSL